MSIAKSLVAAAVLAGLAGAAHGSVVVDYTVDAGGTSVGPLNGLQARATFTISGTTLTIRMQNTSTGTPADFDLGSSFLVSLGFDLPAGLVIVSGDAAVIAPGSVGLGQWSTRSPGDSVGEEWLWTNQYGGDQMDQGGTVARSQIISTSSGQDGATTFRFDGGNGTVDGPSGGMVSSPPQFAVPGNSRGVSDSLDFTLTLNGTMTEAQLAAMAGGSVVEYGSDARYLTVVPGPGSLALLGAGGLVAVRRRRR